MLTSFAGLGEGIVSADRDLLFFVRGFTGGPRGSRRLSLGLGSWSTPKAWFSLSVVNISEEGGHELDQAENNNTELNRGTL